MNSARLILVGWDGADWHIARPLMAAGKLPQLQEIVRHGASGDLRSLPPYLSPMLWNTIATGRSPAAHGIVGFTEHNPATQTIQPMSSRSRRCKALWNMLSQEGRRTHVVGWFASHPAERVNGVCVAESFGKFRRDQPDNDAPRGSVFPEAMAAELAALRLPPSKVEPGLLYYFLPRLAEIDLRRDRRPAKLLERLSELYTYHNAAVALLQQGETDFLAVYYHFIDWICHDFMVYAPPRRPEVSERDQSLYGGVVDAAYQLQDLLLRDLLRHAGAGCHCVVVSDHGFLSGEERPARTPNVTAGIAAWHRNHGIFVAAGPAFASGVRLDGASLYDVTPTILHAFGLPVGKDMPGRVLAEAFRSPSAVKRITSWEARGASLTQFQVGELSRQDAADLLKQFEELGYISLKGDPWETAESLTRRENAWNLGVALLGDGQVQEALPQLEEAYFHNPERVYIAVPLAKCQARLGLITEAWETLRTLEDYGPDHGEAHFYLAEMARICGELDKGLAHLDRAEALGFDGRQIELARGLCLLFMERFDEAEAIYRRHLNDHPESNAGIGLGRTLVRSGRHDEAEKCLRAWLEKHPRSALGWFSLGQALEGLKRIKESRSAYDLAIEIQPDFQRARSRRYMQERALLEAEGRFSPVLFSDWRFDESPGQRRAKVEAARLAKLRAASAERHARWQAERETARALHGPVVIWEPTLAPVAKTDQAPIAVVSGLPRSGTSLMMQMLQRGGLKLKTDERRGADDHNPRGYFEWEAIKTLAEHPERIDEAAGMAVKVVSVQLGHLPSGRRYRIVWMDRPIEEIVLSQERMLLADDPQRQLSPRSTRTQALREHRENVLSAIRRSAAAPKSDLSLIEINYADCLNNARVVSFRLADFLGEQLSLPEQMVQAIDPLLHRTRIETSPHDDH